MHKNLTVLPLTAADFVFFREIGVKVDEADLKFFIEECNREPWADSEAAQ